MYRQRSVHPSYTSSLLSPFALSSTTTTPRRHRLLLLLQLSTSTSTPTYAITDTLTTTSIAVSPAPASAPSYAIRENLPAPPKYAIIDNLTAVHFENSPPPLPPSPISTTSILLPGWEVFVIVPRGKNSSDPNGDFCVFDNNEVSPTKYFGRLPFPDRATFICPLPLHARRRLPFKQPVLTKSPMHPPETNGYSWPLLLQWSHMVYDSLTTNDDVVLFVKGVNIHQGTNRKPSELRCVFGDDASNGVRTAVTTSMQEVFCCPRPEQIAVPQAEPIKVSLEIVTENKVVPSVAYYTPPRRRRHHNRHKSIVLLDAIDDSLLNVVHHFKLRRGYKTKRFISDHIVVNHYKYQAWPEFRAKFRRRVSAYVLDWTHKLNPKSHDRAPGLGFSAVEPDGWPQKFCEVHDHGLKNLARKWFGLETGSGYKMAWQR
ncbi:UNVERIFIED_CONTAM: Glycosyltransferase family 92 protein RCOM [Sesamum angustifolium]|uniref:Glycosyltransferase family 92 protein RCOM n=1 Tax=Sesamum angustifolium TaxID=2727405 RepID=A0AAW2LU01_9LAMI